MSEEKKSEIPEYIQNFPFEPTFKNTEKGDVTGDQNFQKLIQHADFKEIMKNYDVLLEYFTTREGDSDRGRGFLKKLSAQKKNGLLKGNDDEDEETKELERRADIYNKIVKLKNDFSDNNIKDFSVNHVQNHFNNLNETEKFDIEGETRYERILIILLSELLRLEEIVYGDPQNISIDNIIDNVNKNNIDLKERLLEELKKQKGTNYDNEVIKGIIKKHLVDITYKKLTNILSSEKIYTEQEIRDGSKSNRVQKKNIDINDRLLFFNLASSADNMPRLLEKYRGDKEIVVSNQQVEINNDNSQTNKITIINKKIEGVENELKREILDELNNELYEIINKDKISGQPFSDDNEKEIINKKNELIKEKLNHLDGRILSLNDKLSEIFKSFTV